MFASIFDDTSLEENQVSGRQQTCRQHAADWGTSDDNSMPPDIVVYPESTADVSEVVRVASNNCIPVTPYAAGTSLEGNGVPVEGGITVNMTRMNDIMDYRTEDFQVDVQPGVLGSSVDKQVADRGLFFPPLPSSGDISTIGGMIANDAAGMQTVKYGEIHDWVLQMEVVLPNGEIIEVGSKAIKTSSGYNLIDLFVGSEGTLGIITKATLKLAPRPEQIRGGRVLFPDRTTASAAISDIIQSGVDVAKIELIDELSAVMANSYLGSDLPDVPMAFIEFHSNHSIEKEVDFCKAVLDAHDTERVSINHSGREMKNLWETRREMAEALKHYDPELEMLTSGDVTVPISKYEDLIGYISTLETKHDLEIPCFGHAGDGNIHYTVMYPSDDKDYRQVAETVDRRIVRHAIELGGTATGEHGVGLGKKRYLVDEYNERTVDVMRQVKETLDPKNILNPGKIFPT